MPVRNGTLSAQCCWRTLHVCVLKGLVTEIHGEIMRNNSVSSMYDF